jgi:hypothetical protein
MGKAKSLIGKNGKIDYTLPLLCLCGHWLREHEENNFPKDYLGNSFCQECLSLRNSWHDIKLDNLSLVEYLAKERGLKLND